jgi:hypothetical protein
LTLAPLHGVFGLCLPAIVVEINDVLIVVSFCLHVCSFLGLCYECELDGTIQPLIETFLVRWRLPKVHFMFYKYFFKVMGKYTWKQHMAENKGWNDCPGSLHVRNSLKQLHGMVVELQAQEPSKHCKNGIQLEGKGQQ